MGVTGEVPQGSSKVISEKMFDAFLKFTILGVDPGFDPGKTTPASEYPGTTNTDAGVAVYGTTNTVYGTTFTDAGVGIGLKRGNSEI